MTKNERLFRIVAVAGFGLGVYALIRYEVMIHKMTEMIDLIKVEVGFAEIVARYETEDGDN